MSMPGQSVGNLRANAYVNRRGEEEIDAVLNRAADDAHERAVTEKQQAYAEGVENALMWAFGMRLNDPFQEG